MFDFDDWQDANNRYLSTALDWLRERLARFCKTGEGTGESTPDNATAYQPAIDLLAERLELSTFEKQSLLLCSAAELDCEVGELCAEAQGDPSANYATAGLCFSLFENAAWDLLSPDRPLRRYKVVNFERAPNSPLTRCPMRAEERIVNYLKGVNYIDERLAAYISPMDWSASGLPLPISQEEEVERIRKLLAESNGRPPIISLLGRHSLDKRQLATEVSLQMAMPLYQLPVELIPRQVDELGTLIQVWHRESRLLDIGLYVELTDRLDHEDQRAAGQLLRRLYGLVIISSLDDLGGDLGGRSHVVDVQRPTSFEQREVWAERLSRTSIPDPKDVARRLSGQFDLNLSTIDRISGILEESDSLSDADAEDPCDRVWVECCKSTRPSLEDLAQRIEIKSRWDDIVLPARERDQLCQIVRQVRHRGKVLDDWGFRANVNRGLGVTALFAGESGTGKTMAAEVLAGELQLDLYRIDLSSVINKYIGETEKNLRKLFDSAEDGGAILFFDEADALFGKRSEVKSSNDRFANIEVNYLLQRMESFGGLAILATNNKQAMDKAFVRRLRFIVDFQFPDLAQRREIWRKVFPMQTPVESLDFQHLSRMRLTGGNIHNIALNAAFNAADDRHAIDMKVVLDAAKTEMVKSQKPVNVKDFEWNTAREPLR